MGNNFIDEVCDNMHGIEYKYDLLARMDQDCKYYLPAKGIKLLNGINHTRGTWQGSMLRFDKKPEQLSADIVKVIEGAQMKDMRPQDKILHQEQKAPKL